MSSKISVLMGIYNCADTLEQAVLSIQNQSHTNWELILCDDGSTDDTYAVAAALAQKDPRILLLKNEQNLGLNATLNKCLASATGTYIARMDGDDDCLPNRFEKQLEVLDNQLEYAIVSTDMVLFDERGEWGHATIPEFPTPEQVVTGTAIHHAPVMLRRSAMEEVGGYTEHVRMIRVEDVNLWIKLYAVGYRCRNLREPLYRMRNDQNALNRRKYIYRVNSVYVRLLGCKALKLPPIYYLKVWRPMINGLVPARLRQILRKRQRRS